MKDMKAALGSGAKPDITHVRSFFMNYCARACEYGNDKYERANYLRPADCKLTGGADFNRLRAYVRAGISHLVKMLDTMEEHQAGDPELRDVRGMLDAAYSPDTDATPGAKVGASYLPHLAHAIASLNMAVTQAVYAGLLPDDPGQPWKAPKRAEAVPAPIDGDCPACGGKGYSNIEVPGGIATTVDCGMCTP